MLDDSDDTTGFESTNDEKENDDSLDLTGSALLVGVDDIVTGTFLVASFFLFIDSAHFSMS